MHSVTCKVSLKGTTRQNFCGKKSIMSDFEQMPMEPEVPEKLFLQIIQDMEKFDLINSEFGGLSLTVKIY